MLLQEAEHKTKNNTLYTKKHKNQKTRTTQQGIKFS